MTESQSDKRRTALITGASSGIGYELAKQFAKNHHDLILVARNLQVLHKLADDLANQYSISAWTLSKDLANPASPSEIFEELEKQSIKVDYLVCRLLLEKKKKKRIVKRAYIQMRLYPRQRKMSTDKE